MPNSRLDWDRDGFKSIAQIDGPAAVSLEVTYEVKDEYPFEWVVSGFTKSKEVALDRAERAGIAASFNRFRGTALTRELHRLAHLGQAFLVIKGRPDMGALFPILQLALRAADEAENERKDDRPGR